MWLRDHADPQQGVCLGGRRERSASARVPQTATPRVAQVPIVRLTANQIPLDISVVTALLAHAFVSSGSPLGPQRRDAESTTEFVRVAMRAYQPLRPLVLVLKAFLRARALNDSYSGELAARPRPRPARGASPSGNMIGCCCFLLAARRRCWLLPRDPDGAQPLTGMDLLCRCACALRAADERRQRLDENVRSGLVPDRGRDLAGLLLSFLHLWAVFDTKTLAISVRDDGAYLERVRA
jgi:hypothetical protein